MDAPQVLGGVAHGRLEALVDGPPVALAVARALAPLAVDPAKEHAFVTVFLARWGEALERQKGRRRK